MTFQAFKLPLIGVIAALALSGCGGGGDTGPAFAQNLTTEVSVLRNMNGQETSSYVGECLYDSGENVYFREQYSLSRTTNAEQLIRNSALVLFGSDSTCAQVNRTSATFYPQQILIATGQRTLATGEVVEGFTVVDPGGDVITYDFVTATGTIDYASQAQTRQDIIFFGDGKIMLGDSSDVELTEYPTTLYPIEFILSPPAVIPGST
jgi:hypothetical protein